ncbi:MAG: hypothetical protein A3E84_04755 [Gammaproteobacteria bacterium RIFCSPHIGHO2_12_FULL_42_13]|nr:MAG: hypothetical protein A3E84_04755 [Gammaproteobacteria bacterium RIFCSPHIGHO2_12_FULL_42_13]
MRKGEGWWSSAVKTGVWLAGMFSASRRQSLPASEPVISPPLKKLLVTKADFFLQNPSFHRPPSLRNQETSLLQYLAERRHRQDGYHEVVFTDIDFSTLQDNEMSLQDILFLPYPEFTYQNTIFSFDTVDKMLRIPGINLQSSVYQTNEPIPFRFYSVLFHYLLEAEEEGEANKLSGLQGIQVDFTDIDLTKIPEGDSPYNEKILASCTPISLRDCKATEAQIAYYASVNAARNCDISRQLAELHKETGQEKWPTKRVRFTDPLVITASSEDETSASQRQWPNSTDQGASPW